MVAYVDKKTARQKIIWHWWSWKREVFQWFSNFKFLKQILRLGFSRITLWDGNGCLKNVDPASIKLHSMSLMCPWQFKSRHSGEMEGHVPLLNTFFLFFQTKITNILATLQSVFLFSPLFSNCPWSSENYLVGLELLYLKEVEMAYLENRRFD